MFEKKLMVGEYLIDTTQNSLICGSRKVYLGPLRTSLLHFLCKHLNTVVSREDLAQHVWGRMVTDHTINQHISQLRKSMSTLGLTGLNISTIPKRGYIARLDGVEEAIAPQPTASTAAPLVRLRVLMIEGDINERANLHQQLTDCGVALVEVVDSVAAAERATAVQEFDLVLVDTLLPDHEGTRYVKRIRTGDTALAADTRILVTHREVPRELLGFNSLLDLQGVLPKPYEAARVRQLLSVASKTTVSLKPQAAYELVPSDVLTSQAAGAKRFG